MSGGFNPFFENAAVFRVEIKDINKRAVAMKAASFKIRGFF